MPIRVDFSGWGIEKAQGFKPCAFCLLVCDVACETVYENIFRFAVF